MRSRSNWSSAALVVAFASTALGVALLLRIAQGPDALHPALTLRPARALMIQSPDAGAATLTVATTPGWVSARPRDCIASSWRGNLVAARWALCGAYCDCRHAAPCVFQPWSAPRS
jgi:hypothetical protein